MSEFLAQYPEVMETRHLCEILGYTPDTITEMVRRHEIPARKIGKKYIFAKPLIVRMLLNPTEGIDEITDDDAARIAKLR